MEFLNRNLRKKEPDYFYRVSEFVTTFGKDEGENEPFDTMKDFKGLDLLKCKQEAETYFLERLQGMEKTKYFLPFATPGDFIAGKNSAYSITLAFVEYYGDNEEYEHILQGEDADTTSEGREIEKMVLQGKGYI